jgi:hypothetical protein
MLRWVYVCVCVCEPVFMYARFNVVGLQQTVIGMPLMRFIPELGMLGCVGVC